MMDGAEALHGCRYRVARGFTLLELTMALAIVGILAALAVPHYLNAARRAKFTEVITATRVYRLGVQDCFEATHELVQCDAGMQGILPPQEEGGVARINVEAGTITAIGNAGQSPDIGGMSYVLTPEPAPGGALLWSVGGTAKEAGWIR